MIRMIVREVGYDFIGDIERKLTKYEPRFLYFPHDDDFNEKLREIKRIDCR